MKNYWRGVVVSICLVAATIVGIKNLKIEIPGEVASNVTINQQEEDKTKDLEENNSENQQDKEDNEEDNKEESKEDSSKSDTTSDEESSSSEGSKNSIASSNEVSINETGASNTGNTSSIGESNPAPVEVEDQHVNANKELTCTLSISCETILNNMDKLNSSKINYVPSNGIIYGERTVVFNEGESVFDVLLRETKRNRIHRAFRNTPAYSSNYIEGINNLYEFDCGELSGWMYSVNGWYPNYGCSRYELKNGDKIEWKYTCDLGRDLGQYWVEESEN